MFRIVAVEDAALRDSYCRTCKIESDAGALAYAALDISDTGDADLIAVCTVTLAGGEVSRIKLGVINDGDEAVLILLLTVADFLRRCGYRSIVADSTVAPFAARVGFGKADGGFVLDLTAPHGCAESRGEE